MPIPRTKDVAPNSYDLACLVVLGLAKGISMKPKKKPDARKAEVRRLEREVLRLAAIWAAGHDGNWWFEGNAGALERAVVKLEMAKARAGK